MSYSLESHRLQRDGDHYKAYLAALKAAKAFNQCASVESGDQRREDLLFKAISDFHAGQNANLAHDPDGNAMQLKREAYRELVALEQDPSSSADVRAGAALIARIDQMSIAAQQSSH